MKKIALLASMLLLVALPFAQAQDSVAVESATTLYPKQGDIGVVIGADPILRFVGNMFNGNSDNNTREYWKEQQFTVGARYFLFDNLALRAFCRFNPDTYDWDALDFSGSQALESTVNHVANEAAKQSDPLSTARTLNRKVEYNNLYEIRLGAQMFRGKNRLRGFYGGDIMYSFERKASITYTYGNQMSATWPTPANWNGSAAAERRLMVLPNGLHTIGLNAFGGVEFYFYKQMCIGFEAGLMLRAQFSTLRTTVTETVINGEYVQKRETGDTSTNKLHFSTQNPFTGNFYIAFHF